MSQIWNRVSFLGICWNRELHYSLCASLVLICGVLVEEVARVFNGHLVALFGLISTVARLQDLSCDTHRRLEEDAVFDGRFE